MYLLSLFTLVVGFIFMKLLVPGLKLCDQAVRTAKGYWRKAENAASLTEQVLKSNTLDRVFEIASGRFSDLHCLGTREVLKETVEVKDGKELKKQERGNYKFESYRAVYQRVSRIGRGLRKIGVKPGQNVAIYADTQPDWQLSAQACFQQGLPLITVYASLGDEALAHALNETKVSLVFVQTALYTKVVSLIKKGALPLVKFIVCVGSGDAKPENLPGTQTFTLAQIEKEGEDHAVDAQRPSTDDTAVIMYTSGSTGLPKGVVISHKNLVGAMAGLSASIPHLGEEDTYIAYLPLAHVLELAAELCVLAHGGAIGYSSPLTLTDNSPMIAHGTMGDVRALRPTLMAAVPAIMERIRSAVWSRVAKESPIKRGIFKAAYFLKKLALKNHKEFGPSDLLVFNKLKQMLGGRVRMMLSGGAPLSADTELFMRICFCCPVGQGYGLTETCGAGTIKNNNDYTTGRVGPPVGCCEIKLVDWPEGGYTSNDKPFPRGEIVIGGVNVTKGYFNNEEQTNESFKEEDGVRWFYTGDIGAFHEDGSLQIIDRKKDLVKLQHGEYVSLGKVESKLNQTTLIDNSCVCARSDQDFCVAIIVPNKAHLEEFAAKIGVSGSFAELCSNPKLISEFEKYVDEQGKSLKLNKIEVPKKVFITTDEWTPESDLVTAALKLKRKSIEKKYKAQIDALYA